MFKRVSLETSLVQSRSKMLWQMRPCALTFGWSWIQSVSCVLI